MSLPEIKLPKTPKEKAQFNLANIIGGQIIPILFIVICLIGVYFARIPTTFLLNEMVTRLARNSLLVLSLIIPVVAGMGLNFSIVLGAMAGQISLILMFNWGIEGMGGFILAAVIALPIAIIFGYLAGAILNKAKGREMIAGLILGFFANGVYQLVFLVLAGTLIPFRNQDLLLSTGIGLKNAFNLGTMRRVVDNFSLSIGGLNISFNINIGGVNIPLFTFLIIGLFCFTVHWFLKTKLGQDMRAVGQNNHIASVMGINVSRVRILAIILSTVLAAWGQLFHLQSIGTLNTFGSHEQVGLFSVAALLIGGASVTKATIGQALIGTFLFHMLFLVSPLAGRNMFGDGQIGEFFRVFIAYGIIGISLLLHAWQQKRKK